MNELFTGLSNTDLHTLASALQSGRVAPPYSGLQVARVVSAMLANSVREGLVALHEQGFTSPQIAMVLELIAADRKTGRAVDPSIDLVTSGPEAPGITNRDTSVVVRELFSHAKKSVLVVGYAIYQGNRVFESLAKRMDAIPDLDVQFYVNIARPDRDTTASEILVTRFKQRFKDSQWPMGSRLPELYYDPRSIADDEPVRSSLHAKCIVIDGELVFVSSANFTEAGQDRNIEVGLKISNEWLANQLTQHFQQLREHGLALRAF